MKQILFLFLLAGAGVLHAQSYKIPVQNAADGKLTLDNFPGDLPVKGYSGTDIIVSSDRDVDMPDRAKGLKAVYSSGTDNTGVAVAMEKNGNQVTLTCLLPITQQAGYTIQVPDAFMVSVNNECGHSGDVLGSGNDWQFSTTRLGLPCNGLTTDQKTLVLNAIKTFVYDVDDADAAKIYAMYSSEIDNTYILYSGTTTLDVNTDYFRLDGPHVWIEFNVNTQNALPSSGVHYYAVWRDRITDYAGTKN